MDKRDKLEIGTVNFEYPSNWNKTVSNSIDSKLIIFKTENSDSIFAEYGKYNNRFDESKIIVSNDSIFKFIKFHNPGSKVILAIDEELDNNQGIFLDNYYYYTKIANHTGKIMLPKESKRGQMGIYIKDVDEEGNSFSLYSTKSLKGNDSINLLQIFKTIKINSTIK